MIYHIQYISVKIFYVYSLTTTFSMANYSTCYIYFLDIFLSLGDSTMATITKAASFFPVTLMVLYYSFQLMNLEPSSLSLQHEGYQDQALHITNSGSSLIPINSYEVYLVNSYEGYCCPVSYTYCSVLAISYSVALLQ